MSDATVPEDSVDKKPSKLPLVLGLVLAMAGGGGGFYAAQSGLLSGSGGMDMPQAAPRADALPDVRFVPIPALVISLPPSAGAEFLRFRAELEVPRQYASEVESIVPRVVDVLNSYLRAIEPGDVVQPGALIRLRGQMLRRVQLVTGEGRVNNLLVMEFVLN
ncbi:flagellar basal body-associated protein FliL [Aestuariicoccus sp. MJ-SS9]|uniref:flagellar basal body-associated FliL family protein n=1 Tax=Aestuariicoccus sp. MJ-SS9 TaxID=3079855 RepID=UPI002909235B|nr:flagellar basal body-associated FliL family protein [Aestuariicoccus sp. MJ-SS9]MDU8910787.1 flagellar basal body-associated FliL family protein [Aestuariicoccus sp. MJ-SS9]